MLHGCEFARVTPSSLARGADGSVRLFNMEKNVECEYPSGRDCLFLHDDYCRKVCFNDDGSMLASGSDDLKVKV